MALTYGTIWGDYGDEKATGTTQLHALSTRMVLPDGRIFYYGQTDGAQTAGAICQSAVGVANHDMDLAVNTASVGDKSLSVTLGGTAATEDQYKDGYVYVNDGTGEGNIYKIRQHDAINSSAAGTINLYDGDTIAVAFEDATIVGLAKNPYKDFVVYPTTPTGHAVGVAATDFDDDDFGWLQTWGPAAVLCDVAFVIGNHVRVSDNTAGSGEPLDRDGTHENEETIGVASLIAPVTTDYGYVNLTINP
tara:strand:+ start:1361 stop:2104 length:744 start_codon:yes stop_codon:yes gene_type:complete